MLTQALEPGITTGDLDAIAAHYEDTVVITRGKPVVLTAAAA